MNHRMLLDVTQEAERYLFGFRSSVQDGPILLADLPLSEKIGQAFVHLRRLCHNKDARCDAVQAVNRNREWHLLGEPLTQTFG